MRHRSFTLCLAAFTVIILTACSDERGEVADDPSSASSNQPDPPTTSGGTAADASSNDVLALGAAAWKQGNCTMCHGADGRGNSFGPNLTAGQWNHSDGSVAGIRAILIAGIPKEKFHNTSYAMAMPSATSLVPEQDKLDALAAYVKSLSNGTSTNE